MPSKLWWWDWKIFGEYLLVGLVIALTCLAVIGTRALLNI